MSKSSIRKNKVRIWYRFIRKTVNLYNRYALYMLRTRYRLLRLWKYKTMRLAIFFFFRLWLKEIDGFKNIPLQGPALLVSNHLSYYDFLVLGAIFRSQIVFLAVEKINKTFLINFLTKLHIVIYLDRENPGISFFKEVMRQFESRKIVVIYPEGTRSRSGKMGRPKPGFVKLAMKANVPIVPIAMQGTYDILPPNKKIPKLRKCRIVAGEKIYIAPSNEMFKDVFFEKRGFRKFSNLTKDQMQIIADRIMEKVGCLAKSKYN